MSVSAAKPTRTQLHSFLFSCWAFLIVFPYDRGILIHFYVHRFSVFALLGVSPPSHLFCIYFCSHCCTVSPSSHILVVPVLVSIKKTATTNYADAWKTRVNTAIRTATEFCTRHDSEINFWASAGTKRKLEQSGLYNRDCSIQYREVGWLWVVNWKICGRKWSRPIWSSSGSCLESLS